METKINTQLFFSIIIPTLNEEHYLPKLLSCLERQTFRDFEVIVCDGTSSDKTLEVAAKFQDKLPKLTIVNNLKRNVSFQRNEGAKQARGKFFYFMDADVKIGKDHLKTFFKNLYRKKFTVATTWVKGDSRNNTDEALIFLTNLIIDASRYVGRPMAPGFNIVIRKDIFSELGGFLEEIKLAEDHDIVKRAYDKGYKMEVFRKPLLIASLRRLRTEGRLTVARNYTKATLYILFRGPITKELFSYPMGGQYHDKRHSSKNIFNYLSSLSEKGKKQAEKILREIIELP